MLPPHTGQGCEPRREPQQRDFINSSESALFLVDLFSLQQILENIIPARLEGIMGILVEPLGRISGVPQL